MTTEDIGELILVFGILFSVLLIVLLVTANLPFGLPYFLAAEMLLGAIAIHYLNSKRNPKKK